MTLHRPCCYGFAIDGMHVSMSNTINSVEQQYGTECRIFNTFGTMRYFVEPVRFVYCLRYESHLKVYKHMLQFCLNIV